MQAAAATAAACSTPHKQRLSAASEGDLESGASPLLFCPSCCSSYSTRFVFVCVVLVLLSSYGNCCTVRPTMFRCALASTMLRIDLGGTMFLIPSLGGGGRKRLFLPISDEVHDDEKQSKTRAPSLPSSFRSLVQPTNSFQRALLLYLAVLHVLLCKCAFL